MCTTHDGYATRERWYGTEIEVRIDFENGKLHRVLQLEILRGERGEGICDERAMCQSWHLTTK